MEPFLKLMKTYCIDYTNSHDTSWLPAIMTDDYVVNICGHRLQRSASYQESVEALFADAPGLNITIHEIYFNGDRLAMRFSEHATFVSRNNARATWRGFSTYTWDGTRLTECWVEQDFFSRYQQFKSGVPYAPRSPAIDAWMTSPTPEDPNALSAALNWLQTFDLSRATSHSIDDSDDNPAWTMPIVPRKVEITDAFSAGGKVPFHATVTGTLTPGDGKEVRMPVCGVITVASTGAIEQVEAVFDRFTNLVANR
jgi:hypothetical protein